MACCVPGVTSVRQVRRTASAGAAAAPAASSLEIGPLATEYDALTSICSTELHVSSTEVLSHRVPDGHPATLGGSSGGCPIRSRSCPVRLIGLTSVGRVRAP